MVLVLVGVGVLLANTFGASVVAGNARQLHWTNATLGASGIARAAVAQAVFFSFPGVSDQEAKEDALAEARNNLAAVSALRGSGEAPDDRELTHAISEFVGAATVAIETAEDGSPETAETVRTSTVEGSYQDLRTQLEDRQAELAEAIADSDAVAGRIARITFVAIAFMIPAIAMVVFWFVLRRRMRLRETEMAARVEKERELNRAKDELIAGLSHELRTPLTTILGFSEILLEDPSVGGEQRELIGLINSSSTDLSRMVNDLLTAARLDADALAISVGEVDLAEQIDNVVAPYLRVGEPIEVKIPELAVFADALMLRQIVHNLVSNALRHGGDRVLLSADRSKGGVLLVVADNGEGVPPEMEEKLFERFAHMGRQAIVAGSVGLGLAISKELARKLGGELEYRRVAGWTTFSLFLRAPEPEQVLEVEPMAALPARAIA